MSQATPAQGRVVNPVLTNVARGYKNAAFIGLLLFPYVQVAQRGGSIVKFGKEHFRLPATERAPGGDVAAYDFSYSNDNYALTQHAISPKVPVETLEDAAQVPGIDMGSIAVMQGMEIIGLKLEVAQATLARNASAYASSNKVTLSGDTQWSDPDSTPLVDIATGREAIRQKIGRYPNLLTLSAPVFNALTNHADIIERFKYTTQNSITEEMLARLLKVPKVAVGEAVYANPDGTFSDVWGKDAILSYSAPESVAAMGSPSFGYTYRLARHPFAEEPYFNKKNRSWYYPVIDENAPVIAGADAGYLFKSAVA